jgi:predicted metal-binding protein
LFCTVLGTFWRCDVVIVCEPCAGRLTARPAHQIKVPLQVPPLPSATVQSPRRRWTPTPLSGHHALNGQWRFGGSRRDAPPPAHTFCRSFPAPARLNKPGLGGQGIERTLCRRPLVGFVLCGQCSPRTARYDTGKADLWIARPGADAIFGSFPSSSNLTTDPRCPSGRGRRCQS